MKGDSMTAEQIQDGWSLVNDAASVCKPLLWLRDTDSCLPLAPKLAPVLRHALQTVVRLPHATAALCEKMISIYGRAVEKPWVGIGAQERSTRLGRRTAELGLMRALDYARSRQAEFAQHAKAVSNSSAEPPDWEALFSLTAEFIDNLDWGEFVVENARGQASNLVLESIELLQAIQQEPHKTMEETGDVFYNLMACCLSLRIGPDEIAGKQVAT